MSELTITWVMEDGYSGLFTRDQAPRAILNGTRIYKVGGEDGDSTPIGTKGVVLGSITTPLDMLPQFRARFFYFVEWDPYPGEAVGVIAWKIAEDR